MGTSLNSDTLDVHEGAAIRNAGTPQILQHILEIVRASRVTLIMPEIHISKHCRRHFRTPAVPIRTPCPSATGPQVVRLRTCTCVILELENAAGSLWTTHEAHNLFERQESALAVACVSCQETERLSSVAEDRAQALDASLGDIAAAAVARALNPAGT